MLRLSHKVNIQKKNTKNGAESLRRAAELVLNLCGPNAKESIIPSHLKVSTQIRQTKQTKKKILAEQRIKV